MLSPYWPFLYKLSIALHSFDFMLREISCFEPFGQLIIRKINKIGATMSNFIALPQTPLAGFEGPTSKGRNERGREDKEESGGKGQREGEGRKADGCGVQKKSLK